MNDPKRNGDWKEWSQHVLIEIQRMNEKQEKMSDTLQENTKQLEIHIEGVKLAREQNNLIKTQLEVRIDKNEDAIEKIEEKIEPIRDHVKFINTSLSFWAKVLAALVGVPACTWYVINIIMKLKGL